MPSRYNITDDKEIHHLLSTLNVDFGPLPIRYNLAPTDQVPVIHQWEGQRLISDMRWWLVPHWSNGPSTDYPLFNAKYENLENSRAYQSGFRYRRCVIPAHSFVEWQQRGELKSPYLFSAINQAMAFAGVWDYWTDGVEHVLSCAIITTISTSEFELYHPRMPVILTPENAELWLDEKQELDVLYQLFNPIIPFSLEAIAIDSQYGNSRNKNKPILIGDKEVIKK